MTVIKLNFEEDHTETIGNIIDWLDVNGYYSSYFKSEFLEWLDSLEHYRVWTSVRYSNDTKSWKYGWTRLGVNIELKKLDVIEFKLRWA